MATETPRHSSYEERKRSRQALVEKRRREQARRRKQLIVMLGGCLLLVILVLGISAAVKGISGLIRANARKVSEAVLETDAEVVIAAETMEDSFLSAANYRDEEVAFSPHAVAGTEPSRLITSSEIMVDGAILENNSDYRPWQNMFFRAGSSYTDLEGVITFRGNNFRNAPSFGTVSLESHSLQVNWTADTGTFTYNNKTWTGSGWTGQPLLVRWPKSTKAVMNMYNWAKEDDDLVEAIYACLDGCIYFLDAVTGKQTRDTLDIGYAFKGAGALDPRGYPILYVGSGYTSYNGRSRAFIISLIDGSILHTFGPMDEFAYRETVSFFDASPLVDAASDTLIWPGENGLLYLLHLNTAYNESAGTLSVEPDHMVKWRYEGSRMTEDAYWQGMEDSPAIYGGYMFIADNGGNLICLNLNTLTPVWVQDILDDSNSTPVLSVENGHLYLYISTSFHLGWRSWGTAAVPVWKIDAETGEIIWQKDYICHSVEEVSGGVQSTIACGRLGLDDYIYVTVSMTKDTGHGVLACLRKATGEVVWEHEAAYAWSSPVCVYEEDGTGTVLYCTSAGTLFMLDGITGKTWDHISLGDATIEASPALFGNYLVVGTRDCEIWGIELK